MYFLSHKSETKTPFDGLLKRIKTQFGRKIKTLRTDHSSEFTDKDMQEIMRKNGIKHETSTAYTPEQDGAIERENRTIVEAARSMLHAKRMDLKLWAEAVYTATYVINRTGTSSIKGKNPYKLWHDESAKKIDYKIFGTEVWTHIPKQKRTKWSAKAKSGIFVGYDDCTNGYRIWFPSEGKVQIHRDVKSCQRKPAKKRKKRKANMQ